MAKKDYKRCPRCGAKTYFASKQCSVCDLKFDRLKNLSNKEAKKAIKEKQTEKVLYLSERPADVSKRKFMLLYLLLGWFGGHNIYVGKYKRGFYSLISLSAFLIAFIVEEILFFNGVDTAYLNYYLVMPLCTFAVFGIIIWFMDMVALFTKTYKYPSALSVEDYLKYAIKSQKFNSSKVKKVEVDPNQIKGISKGKK